MKKTIDFNCDMGEGFGNWFIGDNVEAQIMTMISSANIAAGFHAGDPNILRRTIAMAKKNKVKIGAHPGFRDLVGFGRRYMTATAEELVNDVIYQLGAVREFTHLESAPLHHLKLHGALYMHAARDEEFADALVKAVHRLSPELPIYGMPNTALARAAKTHGQPYVREFFSDRDYGDDGMIVLVRKTRTYTPKEMAQKVVRACKEGKVKTISGADIDIDFDSICMHTDTAGSFDFLKAVTASLKKNRIKIHAPKW